MSRAAAMMENPVSWHLIEVWRRERIPTTDRNTLTMSQSREKKEEETEARMAKSKTEKGG